MIKIAILGDIGSGKSFVAKQFGYPVFNADNEVKKIYNNDRNCYKKLKKVLPKYLLSFPINKKEITKSILSNQKNLQKVIKI
ncbi:dephospho-CoA kinase, partial [Candidatus Pelagibacter sp.]|nr:dephospho-CoA kinase [Candidatus Pelagibacter sp.]